MVLEPAVILASFPLLLERAAVRIHFFSSCFRTRLIFFVSLGSALLVVLFSQSTLRHLSQPSLGIYTLDPCKTFLPGFRGIYVWIWFKLSYLDVLKVRKVCFHLLSCPCCPGRLFGTQSKLGVGFVAQRLDEARLEGLKIAN